MCETLIFGGRAIASILAGAILYFFSVRKCELASPEGLLQGVEWC
jgi:hypothetical protein